MHGTPSAGGPPFRLVLAKGGTIHRFAKHAADDQMNGLCRRFPVAERFSAPFCARQETGFSR
jgi:hypothetical protein